MRFILKLLPIFVLVILVVIFFNKTLTGEQIFATPDFGQSDILSGEYPVKFFLSESLRQDQLPLWNSKIATGFPQIGTITGSFNPLNLLIFKYLPMPIAYNLSFALIFLSTAIFTYLYAQSLSLSRVASLLSAISFTFSGIFATQIVHFTVIQTLSYFPIQLFLVEIYIQNRKPYVLTFLALAIGFQILAGFYQVVLYSLIVLFLYSFYRIFLVDERRFGRWTLFFTIFGVVLTGFMLAAIQLLPSWEFTQISTRAGGVSHEEVKLFPYPIKHLVSFIWPYFLGDPRIGTYPQFSKDWGIFWENTGYIGILPLLFAFLAIILGFRKNKTIQLFAILAFISLLLMLGKNSPTFFFFQTPPLSFFRVPSRWIMFLVFSLSILAAFGFDFFWKKLETKIASTKVIMIILLLILITTTANLFLFSYNYNLRGETQDWLKTPTTALFLQNDQSLYRIASFGNQTVWNEQFLNRGWLKDGNNYITFLEGLDPNWNIVQNINQVNAYAIILTKRDDLTQAILGQNIKQGNNAILLQEVARNLLDLENVKYIISPFEVSGRDLDRIYKTQSQLPYFIYQNTTVMPRVFTVSNYEVAQTPKDQIRQITSPKFDYKTTVIIEKDLKDQSFKQSASEAKIANYSDQNVEIEAKMSEDGILVLADAFYPGWKAYVDGKESEILAANINQRSLILPKGNHFVKFTFAPTSFKIGAIISLVSTIALLVSFLFFFLKEKKIQNRPDLLSNTK